MLRWRLLIGAPLVLFIAFICWVDAIAPFPGVALMPFFLVCSFFLCGEILRLLNAGGVFPKRSTVYVGVIGTILLSWLSCAISTPHIGRLELATAESARHVEDVEVSELAESQIGEVVAQAYDTTEEWRVATYGCFHVLLAIAAGVLIAFVGEMFRYRQPGGSLINLGGAVFAIVYIGMLGAFMALLRVSYGLMAVISMVFVTKMCDIGAYTVGRLVGRHKMAPYLSPGKTIEGGIGGLAFSVLAAWISTQFLFPLATGRPSETTWIGIVVYGVVVGFVGALGDLAESLIKRDVMRKDSGLHVPGFGGFLDIFDSLLLAAPVALGLWAFHIIKM